MNTSCVVTNSNNFPKIGVYGAGAFGTAISLALDSKSYLFFKDKDQFEETITNNINPYLPNIVLKDSIIPTMDNRFLKGLDILFLVVPVQNMMSAITDTLEFLSKETQIIIASKGIVCDELISRESFLDKKISKMISNNISVMSGPNFAFELALGDSKNFISLTCLANKDYNIADSLSKRLSTKRFKFYPTDDVTGVLFCGAIKNIYAIASGIAKNVGKNAHAALLTSAISEMQSLGIRIGAKQDTFFGLAGIGDLILTCSNMESRNMRLGDSIANNNHNFSELAEGAFTAKAIFELSKSLGIKMPIASAVFDVLYNKSDPKGSIIKALGC